jgi:type VI secretion system (T6SS) phospholipase Tle1-like effector
MSAAEAAMANMSKATGMAVSAPNGTVTCPNGQIRIGVFFDGTGNNTWRDYPTGLANDVGTSDNNGPTNVAKLHRIFIEQGSIQKKVYHHGPGTDSFGDHPRTDHPGWIRRKANAAADQPGMLFGAGGKARTRWGLQQLSVFFSQGTNHLAVKKIIDTYGFSRGAAIARDFVSSALSEGVDNLQAPNGFRVTYIATPDGGAVPVRTPAYHRHQHVIFNFLGVFDTVAAFGPNGVGNGAYNFFIDHNKVDHTVHMIAEDEVRTLFPVSSLFMDPKGAGYQNPLDYSSSMVELWYPGVHSDLGGSYLRDLGKPGEAATTGYAVSEFGATPYPIAAVPPVLPIQQHLAHIPLRDMHKASRDQTVPFAANLAAVGPAHLWEIPGPLLEHYNAYDAYRQGKRFGIGAGHGAGSSPSKSYIQNFAWNEYNAMYHHDRESQASIQWLRIHMMHDSRMAIDHGAQHKRTVLYMGRQPPTRPREG